MTPVSIQPLLDALNRAKKFTITVTSQVVSIDEILISSDLRAGLVASIFVVTDQELEATSLAVRLEVERTLLEQVVQELSTLRPEQLPDGTPQRVRRANWLSCEDLRRDYDGSYDRYMRN